LPEDEVKDIVRQILKGLAIMHSESFAHQDQSQRCEFDDSKILVCLIITLQNILVMKASPPSWMKHGDLGQSEQAGGAKYHTVTGTRSYAAHEVRETTNTESLDYTNALDI
jgi:serine/threonine protein kinase